MTSQLYVLLSPSSESMFIERVIQAYDPNTAWLIAAVYAAAHGLENWTVELAEDQDLLPRS